MTSDALRSLPRGQEAAPADAGGALLRAVEAPLRYVGGLRLRRLLVFPDPLVVPWGCECGGQTGEGGGTRVPGRSQGPIGPASGSTRQRPQHRTAKPRERASEGGSHVSVDRQGLDRRETPALLPFPQA